MGLTEEPIISRLDRLDNMLRQLEETRGYTRSPKSSCASSTSSDGKASSVESSLEKHCRPIERVMMETEVKGTLVERVEQVEERLLKVEEELVGEKKGGEEMNKKRGLKQLLKQCIKGGGVK